MQPSIPSRTALRVALRRAAHQLYDEPPLVFTDPLAVRILGPHARELGRTPGRGLGRRPGVRARTHSFSLRAFLVARSRYTEDLLAAAYAAGTRQYILLGAGLDTFAYRNPWPDLRVIEADHPATQTWKHELLAQAGIPRPANLASVPLDLESDNFAEPLSRAGLDPHLPAFFAALGVVPYLSPAAFDRMLAFFAAHAFGSAAVFDYTQPRHEHTGFDQLALDSMSARLRATGEPFQLHHSPADLDTQLRSHGLTTRHVGADELNHLYFTARTDSLRVLPSAGRILSLRW